MLGVVMWEKSSKTPSENNSACKSAVALLKVYFKEGLGPYVREG